MKSKEHMNKIINGIVILTVVLAVIVFLIVCFSNRKLLYGKYGCEDNSFSRLQINDDGTFVYYIDSGHNAPNWYPTGIYVVEDNKLILVSDEGEFEFKIKHKKLVLEKGNELTDEYIGNGTEYIFKTID